MARDHFLVYFTISPYNGLRLTLKFLCRASSGVSNVLLIAMLQCGNVQLWFVEVCRLGGAKRSNGH